MFPEVDPVLGPEMRSTGEVLGLASTFGEAFFKAQEATQTVLPTSGTVLISVCDRDKDQLTEVASEFIKAGMKIVATGGTYQHLADAGIKAVRVLKKSEGRPNLIDMIINGEVDLVINTPSGTANSSEDGTAIRKAAIKAHVPYMTTMAAAKATALGIQAEQQVEEHRVVSLQEVHAKLR